MSDAGTSAVLVVVLALIGGAVRVSTPFLYVSLGECLTERSGRINLGLEGTLVLGAMTGYAVSYLSGWPWLGVVLAGVSGLLLGALHASLCQLPRVNDIAIGIALMQFGTGLAFFLGKPFIEPTAPRLSSIPFGSWSSSAQVQNALQVNVLFLIGVGIAVFMWWALRSTRWGLTRAYDRRQRSGGARTGRLDQQCPAGRNGDRRVPRRSWRRVSFPVLPGKLE